MRNRFAFFIERVGNHFGFETVIKAKSGKLRDMIQKPIRTILDIGANDGLSAKWFLKTFPGAKVYSFEPLPAPFARLDQWAKKQGGKAEAFNFAFGEKEGEATCFLTPDYDKSSSVLKFTARCSEIYPFTVKQEPLKVRMRMLDNAVQEIDPLPLPGLFIKMDVQGYEDRVIKGGTRTFASADACMLEINLDALYEGQASFEGLLMLMKDSGLHYAGNFEQAVDDDGHVIFVDAVFVK